jgi:hypothetical protein
MLLSIDAARTHALGAQRVLDELLGPGAENVRSNKMIAAGDVVDALAELRAAIVSLDAVELLLREHDARG